MKQLIDIFLLPPLAIARLGPGEVPVEAFVWTKQRTIHGAHQTTIRPAVTLEVEPDGSVRPFLPKEINFRINGRLRPVAPFFELWGRTDTDGVPTEEPITLELLRELGISSKHVQFSITVANRKAQRRTGSPACSFIASASARGNEHDRKQLLAVSPHNAAEVPLVPFNNPIPLGFFQVVRPAEGKEADVDLSQLRVRFTPAGGEVYGPPIAVAGPASPLPPGGALNPKTSGGRIHQIVPERNRILNPGTPWSAYVMDESTQEDPQPSDSYDGADAGDNCSWGVVDDSCDGLVEAQLVVDGFRHVAQARVISTCPDFAPDRRPFYSLADDLADRDLPILTKEQSAAASEEVAELFQRVFETASLFNLDAARFHGIAEDAGDHENPADLPKIDDRTMTAEDTPFVDLVPTLLPVPTPGADSGGVPPDPLPYTHVARAAHAPLSDVGTLMDFLSSRKAHVRSLLRPPYGRFREFGTTPASVPAPNFRDPRLLRDLLQDMRMPPYMRDSDETSLSLTYRQYRMLIEFIDQLPDRAEPPGGPVAG